MRPSCCISRDHPRERGDHVGIAQPHLGPMGPPPRARGPRPPRHPVRVPPGTTPASAGTTSRPSSRPPPRRDHPRERGDHSAWTWNVLPDGRPPPRARGPRRHVARLRRPGGTTPASAGTTWASTSPTNEARDHPRERGDHTISSRTRMYCWGPPPRARGPFDQRQAQQLPDGTTPASAGTTCRLLPGKSVPGDHPRERGDHRMSAAHTGADLGPPPRARGPHFLTSEHTVSDSDPCQDQALAWCVLTEAWSADRRSPGHTPRTGTC